VTEELGFDACIDHRTSDFVSRLAAAAKPLAIRPAALRFARSMLCIPARIGRILSNRQ
jgi:hypothetical protein